MATDAITSQPALNSHVPTAVPEQPPSYDEVISTQPKSSAFNVAINDKEVTLENEHTDALFNSEQEDKCENCEEQQRRNINKHSDCCCVCFVEDDPGWWICCRLFSNCCICIADCTETCCESCGECLQTCCDSDTSANIDFGGCDCACCD